MLAPQKVEELFVCKMNTDKITHGTTSLFLALIYYDTRCANTHLLQSTWFLLLKFKIFFFLWSEEAEQCAASNIQDVEMHCMEKLS